MGFTLLILSNCTPKNSDPEPADQTLPIEEQRDNTSVNEDSTATVNP